MANFGAVMAAGAIAGAVGGGMGAALNGGNILQGVVMGAAIGTASGGFVGSFAPGLHQALAGIGLGLAGAGVAYAQGGLDGLAYYGAGVAGAIVGSYTMNWIADPKPLSFQQMVKLVRNNNLSGQSDEMILCIAKQESDFIPTGQNSDSSARGLMGITAGAAKDVKYDYGSLFDPETNIKAGSLYLKQTINVNGSVAEGLSHYGTGPAYSQKILGCESCLREDPNDCFAPLREK
jgi:hypothetical protein